MDKGKMRMLVTILMDSSLYETMTHEEKMALLFRLIKDYPALIS